MNILLSRGKKQWIVHPVSDCVLHNFHLCLETSSWSIVARLNFKAFMHLLHGRWVTPIWKGQGCSLCMYLLAVKKAVLVLLRMFSLKRSTAGTFIVPCRVLSRNKITGNYVLFKGTFLWDDLDQDRWSKITRIVVHQRNRWIHDQSGFIGSFDAPWSEWSWITDPDPDHPKGMHP